MKKLNLNEFVRYSDEPQLGEVYSQYDIDNKIVCQIFLREGYTMLMENMTVTKDGSDEY